MRQPVRTDIFPGITGPLLFGHRGFSQLAPENTLSAFRLLLEHGIPGVEFDVHLCASGEVVVFHDDDLQRVCGVAGLVAQTPLAHLERLDAGSHFSPRFAGERIPRLEQVLDLLGREVYYDIELKTRSRHCGELEGKVLAWIEAYGLQHRVLFSSFNPFSLRALRKLGWQRNAIIYMDHEALPPYLRRGQGRWLAGCPILKPDHRLLQRRRLCMAHNSRRFPMLAWTVDEASEAAGLLARGVAGIISNNPGTHLGWLDQKDQQTQHS